MLHRITWDEVVEPVDVLFINSLTEICWSLPSDLASSLVRANTGKPIARKFDKFCGACYEGGVET
ncbi:MAG: hypothetical protein C4582_08995 [Desulfobacteraceae bacterium]|nr:MAG: hypothetical protein C4582_08995 [Desulfobacteraceae bacterium]